MKKIILSLLVLTATLGFAQSEKYNLAMKANLAKLDTAKSAADLEAMAAAFTRIGDAEKTQWLPYYWAGLALSNVGWMDAKADKDVLGGRILALCDKADAIATDNADKAEILVLRNMAATQQMLVDPQARYMTYGQQAATHLQKGMSLNANNPRLYYLQGMSLFNTPEQFGGGKAKAKPVFEKAVSLYKSEQAKPLHPYWGDKMAADMLAQCQ
ncbi:MAG TPA: hypothetical protein VM935_09335 [Chitinophagaceae bacterium]|nr:hypothetical protein [Chitinophagaceae bacterium]